MNGFDPENSGPLTRRQQRILLIGVTLVVIITQLMLSQVARAEPPKPGEGIDAPFVPQVVEPAERFVPGTARFDRGATLELRGEATVAGGEVRLKQICRWAAEDNAVFEPIGELIVLRLGQTTPFQAITLPQLKQLLHDAGVNLAAIRMVGAGKCTVGRSDVQFDEASALDAWAKNREETVVPDRTPAASTTQVVTDQPGLAGTRRLRDILCDDLCRRLKLDPATLQLDFRASDGKILDLAEPQFRFDIKSLRGSDLGDVAWNVTLLGDHGAQRVSVSGIARAWQNQLVAARPLATKQTFRAADFEPRRVLADKLPQDVLLTSEQVINQQAARDIRPGMVLTARLIEPAQLVKAGQLVSVTISEGAVLIRTSGKAQDNGTFGQVVRIRNEATNEIYKATVTGPQAASLSAEPPAVASVPLN